MQHFDVLLGHPVWWICEPSGKLRLLTKPTRKAVSCPGLTPKGQNKMLSSLKGVMGKTTEHFKENKPCCPKPYQALIYPLGQGSNFYGAILICHLQEEILKKNRVVLGLFEVTINSILEEVQKELELNKLYETLRPRAIALSTVHTIHRIIGTTMTMKELLPKVARLCLQILKVRACSILLYDDKKKKLVPRVSIGIKQKEVTLNRSIPGKVVKTGTYHREDKILSVPLLNEDIVGCIVVYEKLDHKPFSISDQEILLTLAEQATIAIENARLYEEQQKMVIGTVKSLARILDFISPKTYTHSGKFVELTMALAKELKLSQQDMTAIYYAAVLHDAGEVGISDEILKKKDKLDQREIDIIRRHPASGVSIIEPLSILKPAVPLVLYHHERYDGRGYPDGLKGKQIPIGARIMAVADAFEAMVSEHSYRDPKSMDEALAELKRCSGTQFDPEVVNAFENLYRKGTVHKLLAKKRSKNKK